MKYQDIGLIKGRYGCETSEILFGIDEQPEYQCRHITNIICGINDACKYIECKIANGDIDDIKVYLNDFCTTKEKELEALRNEVEAIREWGQGWKNLAKSVLSEMKRESDVAEYFSENAQKVYKRSREVIVE